MKILLVLLTILKAMGIFLLAVLLLLLLLLFLVLFTPLGYGATGQKIEKIKGSFFVTWLFGGLRAAGVYEEGKEVVLSAKLFGFSFLGEDANRRREEKRKKKREKQRRKQKKPTRQRGEEVPLSAREKEPPILEKQETEMVAKEESKGVFPPEKNIEEKVQEVVVQQQQKKEIARESALDSMGKGTNQGEIRRVKMTDIKEIPPPKEFVSEEEIQGLEGDFSEEETGKGETWKRYYRQFQEIPDKREIFRSVCRFIRRVFKNVLPKNLFLKATVGTGDPALTGELLGLLGIAKMKFGKNLQVTGDFAKADLRDVEIRIKGRIYLGSLVIAAAQLVWTKPIWALIKKYWKQRKDKR